MLFDNPKDVPFDLQTYKFAIDDWEFVVVFCYTGDVYRFQWSELVHRVCMRPMRFVIHRHEFRGYCPKCDVRMPRATWEAVKHQVNSLKPGFKLS